MASVEELAAEIMSQDPELTGDEATELVTSWAPDCVGLQDNDLSTFVGIGLALHKDRRDGARQLTPARRTVPRGWE